MDDIIIFSTIQTNVTYLWSAVHVLATSTDGATTRRRAGVSSSHGEAAKETETGLILKLLAYRSAIRRALLNVSIFMGDFCLHLQKKIALLYLFDSLHF